jgi:hypothetical protein
MLHAATTITTTIATTIIATTTTTNNNNNSYSSLRWLGTFEHYNCARSSYWFLLIQEFKDQATWCCSQLDKPLHVVARSQADVRPSCLKHSHYFVHKACDWT